MVASPGGREDDEAPRHVIVLAGGDAVVPPLPYALPPHQLVIAADAGLAVAAALDLDVDLLVGDLDSVEPTALEAARAAGVRIERHPIAKDRTDLEIAMDQARAAGAELVTVVGGAGGRFDHLIAVPLLLASSAYAGMRITAVTGAAVLTVVRGSRVITGRAGELIGLMAVHGDARGVTTTGLRYPLVHEDLKAGSSRGVSNVLDAPTVTVSVNDGALLAIQPGAMAPDGLAAVMPDENHATTSDHAVTPDDEHAAVGDDQ